MAEIEKDEIIELDEGTDTEDPTIDDVSGEGEDPVKEEDEPEEDQDALRKCKGLFADFPVSDYTQDKRYSDTYLKQRNLYKEVTEEE